MRLLRGALRIAFVVVAWTMGCSSSSTGGGLASEDAGDHDATAPSAGSAVIGSSGGAVSLSNGVGVTIPAGALSKETTITVTPSPSSPTPAHVTSVGTPYVLGPEGLTFAKPVTVTLVFDPSQIPTGATASSVEVFTAPVGSTQFTTLSSTVASGTTVRATTTHFSVFEPGVGASTDAGATTDATQVHPPPPGDATTADGGSSDATVDAGAGDATIDAKADTDAPASADGSSTACTVLCGVDAGAGDPTYAEDCKATCNGHTYAVDCACPSSGGEGSCTCLKDGAQTGTAMGCGTATSSAYTQTCGFPGTFASTPPTDAGNGCTVMCDEDAGAGAPTYGEACKTTCDGHTYALDCSCPSSGGEGSCTCLEDGAQTGTAMGCGTATNNAYTQTCGFPGSFASAPPADAGSSCSMSCGDDAGAGQPTYAEVCKASCDGHTYAIDCSCPSSGGEGSCTCLKDGTATGTTMGCGTADTNAFTTGCGFP